MSTPRAHFLWRGEGGQPTLHPSVLKLGSAHGTQCKIWHVAKASKKPSLRLKAATKTMQYDWDGVERGIGEGGGRAMGLASNKARSAHLIGLNSSHTSRLHLCQSGRLGQG